MKRCNRCMADKPETDFYSYGTRGHLLFAACKECTKVRVRANYEAKRERYSAYERMRAQDPQRKAMQAEACKLHKQRYPERAKARTAVGNAVRDGKLFKKPCQVCGCLFVQAHHHDYSRPLDVEWLCFTCHRTHGHGQVVTAHA